MNGQNTHQQAQTHRSFQTTYILQRDEASPPLAPNWGGGSFFEKGLHTI